MTFSNGFYKIFGSLSRMNTKFYSINYFLDNLTQLPTSRIKLMYMVFMDECVGCLIE